MIFDHLENTNFYEDQHPQFKKAFDFLRALKESDFEKTRIDLDGDNCFVLLSKSEGKGKENLLMESHKKYLDIQFVFSGSDCIGYKNISECQHIHTPYVEKDDYMLYSDKPAVDLIVYPKYFTIFYPHDVHAPLIGNGPVFKAVVKVKI